MYTNMQLNSTTYHQSGAKMMTDRGDEGEGEALCKSMSQSRYRQRYFAHTANSCMKAIGAAEWKGFGLRDYCSPWIQAQIGHHGNRHRLVTMEIGTAVVCNY